MKAYRIANWDERFETISNPEDLDLRLIEASKLLSKGKEGAAALAVWLLLVKFASKMPQRGLLVSVQKALTARCLADATGFSERLIQVGIDTLMSPDMRWVEQVDCPKYLILGNHAMCGHIASAPEVVAVVEAEDSAPLISMSTFPPALDAPKTDRSPSKEKRSVEWKKTQPKYKNGLRQNAAKNRWRTSMPGSFFTDEDDFLGKNQQPGTN